MLSKLAWVNVKRSIKDYAIYLLTVTLSFSFMFAFLLISNAKDVLSLASIMHNFKDFMFLVNFFIVLVVCFLIHYTTKFMFQKRSKEFGTYMLLGIKKKYITRMFTLENIIFGFFSFLLAIPLGYLFSLFMSFVIMHIFSLPYIVKIHFDTLSILTTFLYFIVIYCIVLLLSYRRMKKMKIYDLLYFEKQNEKMPQIKPWSRNLFFFLSLGLGIFSLLLFDQQFSEVGTEPSFLMITICLFLLIISIYGTIYTASDFILQFVLKKKKRKYQGDALFIARTFSAKVRTMRFTMGTLTLFITLTLLVLNVSSLMKGLFDYQIEQTAPYDISIGAKEEELPKYMKMIEENYTVRDKFYYHNYQDTSDSITEVLYTHSGWREKDQFIKVSDYNQLLKLRGMPEVTLKEGEYLLHVTKEYREILGKAKSIQTIHLSNGVTLKQKYFISEGYTYAWGAGYGFAIVVPDSAVTGLAIGESHLIVNTKEKTTEAFAHKLLQLGETEVCSTDEDAYQVCYSLSNVTVRGQEEANNNGFITITSFVCFYMAFIFTAVVGTILAIQLLSDATKYQYRYQVLRKLGVTDDYLYQMIRKQLLLFFLFPLVYPILVSFCTMYSMNRIFQIALPTDTTYIMYFFINLALFLLLYFLYFIATYFGFKKNIDE